MLGSVEEGLHRSKGLAFVLACTHNAELSAALTRVRFLTVFFAAGVLQARAENYFGADMLSQAAITSAAYIRAGPPPM